MFMPHHSEVLIDAHFCNKGFSIACTWQTCNLSDITLLFGPLIPLIVEQYILNKNWINCVLSDQALIFDIEGTGSDSISFIAHF